MRSQPAIDFFLTAIVCLSKREVVLIRKNALSRLPLQGAKAIVGGSAITDYPAANAAYIQHIVNIGFPIIGRPIDGF